ncbi:MAG: hypothetical protein ABI855_19230 [Bacteroidota bacterium]
MKGKLLQYFKLLSKPFILKFPFILLLSEHPTTQHLLILALRDKNGKILSQNDILSNGKDYFHIYYNERFKEFEMIGGDNGYVHNIQPKDLVNFTFVGSFEELKDNSKYF